MVSVKSDDPSQHVLDVCKSGKHGRFLLANASGNWVVKKRDGDMSFGSNATIGDLIAALSTPGSGFAVQLKTPIPEAAGGQVQAPAPAPAPTQSSRGSRWIHSKV